MRRRTGGGRCRFAPACKRSWIRCPFPSPTRGRVWVGGAPLLGSLALTPPASALPTRREEVWSASSYGRNPNDPHTLCSQSDRLSAHRRRSHGSVHLVIRASIRRSVPPPYRRYGRWPQSTGGAATDPRRLPLARHRLGRRPRSRRPLWTLLSIRTTRPLSSRCENTAREGAGLLRLRHGGGNEGRTRSGGESETAVPLQPPLDGRDPGRSRPLGVRRTQGRRPPQDATRRGLPFLRPHPWRYGR